MADEPTPTDGPPQTAPPQPQAEQPPPGLFGEFVYFMRHNKKWWLTPIILVILAIGILMLLGSPSVAPFIYPMR